MKYIKSKKISPRKYHLTLECSDKDIEMLEDLALTYAPFQQYEDTKNNLDCIEKLPDDFFTDKFRKWLNKTWRIFCRIWREHDSA